MATVEGRPDGAGVRVGLVVSRFNDFVTTRLRAGAEACLERHAAYFASAGRRWRSELYGPHS